MIHMHNHSTLLGAKSKSVYYPPNGTGRDSYIMIDNGGTNINYKCQGVPQLGNYMKFGKKLQSFKPASHTRFQKYCSDGTGRDHYVVSQHGGQYHEDDEKKLLLVKFQKTMRDGGWSSNSKNTTGTWLTSKETIRNKMIGRQQSIHDRKLSAPKKTSQKYQARINQIRQSLNK